MAVTDTHRAAASVTVSHGFSGIVAKFLAWKVAYQTRKALSRLSDRQLEDIGLDRSDIARIR
jgi:uncharacterized protein YjiS (DUF1127 family)